MAPRRLLFRSGIVLLAAGLAWLVVATGYWAWPRSTPLPRVMSSEPVSAAEEKGRVVPLVGDATMDEMLANCTLVQNVGVACCLMVLGGVCVAVGLSGRAAGQDARHGPACDRGEHQRSS